MTTRLNFQQWVAKIRSIIRLPQRFNGKAREYYFRDFSVEGAAYELSIIIKHEQKKVRDVIENR